MVFFADSLVTLGPDARMRGLEQILVFMRTRLGPHAAAEERVLYPTVAEILGVPGMQEPMVYDHRRIERLSRMLDDQVARLRDAAGNILQVQHLLHELCTLIRAHLDEEEEVYLATLDERLTAAEGRELTEEMRIASGLPADGVIPQSRPA